MISKTIFTLFLVLALASMACSVTVNLPEVQLKTGPTQTENINVPAPTEGSANVTLVFGAGEFSLAPGAQDALISGQATYNVPDFKPELTVAGSNVRLSAGSLDLKGIPRFSGEMKNQWDLKLGDQPMDLTINAGAYQARYELGGLNLQSLKVIDGAADVRLNFSEPNKIQMSTLSYETGASNVRLEGLANANFRDMSFRSGAGDYTLEFSGQLQQDANIDVRSGISQVTIIVPQGASANLSFKGGISNVDVSGDWSRSGSQYLLSGSGPTLNFNVEMGAGSLNLRTQ